MKHITIFFCLSVLLSSCDLTRPGFLPQPDNFQQFPKGHHFEGEFGSGQHRLEIFGEMICMTDTSLVLLSEEFGVNEYNIADIDKGFVTLSLATNGSEMKKLKTTRAVALATTLAHGWWMILTVPLNLIVTTNQSNKTATGTYLISLHDAKWNNLRKFCRFPQGMPEGINQEDLYYIGMPDME